MLFWVTYYSRTDRLVGRTLVRAATTEQAVELAELAGLAPANAARESAFPLPAGTIRRAGKYCGHLLDQEEIQELWNDPRLLLLRERAAGGKSRRRRASGSTGSQGGRGVKFDTAAGTGAACIVCKHVQEGARIAHYEPPTESSLGEVFCDRPEHNTDELDLICPMSDPGVMQMLSEMAELLSSGYDRETLEMIPGATAILTLRASS